MDALRVIVIGAGPSGGIAGAFLIRGGHDVLMVDNAPGLVPTLLRKGLTVTGAVDLAVPVRHAVASLAEAEGWDPDLVLIATKAPVVPRLCPALEKVVGPRTVLVSYQNGIDVEEPLTRTFGLSRVARAVVRYGAIPEGPGRLRMTFWHRPNFLGALAPRLGPFCERASAAMTASGLPTRATPDIRTRVWEKAIANAMNSLSAVTGLTIGGVLDIPALRETFLALLEERIAIARAHGIALPEGCLRDLVAFHEKAREHMPSTCSDVQQGLPTEVDWLEGKFVEYARKAGIPAPIDQTLLALMKGRTAANEAGREVAILAASR